MRELVPLLRRRVGEVDAVAAVHLQVDETRGEDAVPEVDVGRAAAAHVDDATAVELDHRVLEHAARDHDARCSQARHGPSQVVDTEWFVVVWSGRAP